MGCGAIYSNVAVGFGATAVVFVGLSVMVVLFVLGVCFEGLGSVVGVFDNSRGANTDRCIQSCRHTSEIVCCCETHYVVSCFACLITLDVTNEMDEVGWQHGSIFVVYTAAIVQAVTYVISLPYTDIFLTVVFALNGKIVFTGSLDLNVNESSSIIAPLFYTVEMIALLRGCCTFAFLMRKHLNGDTIDSESEEFKSETCNLKASLNPPEFSCASSNEGPEINDYGGVEMVSGNAL